MLFLLVIFSSNRSSRSSSRAFRANTAHQADRERLVLCLLDRVRFTWHRNSPLTRICSEVLVDRFAPKDGVKIYLRAEVLKILGAEEALRYLDL